MSLPLKQLQSILYRLITAASGVAEGLAAEKRLATEGGMPPSGLEALVLGDDRLSAEDRVDIYANMYFYRLLDVLKEDFPAMLRVLGDDNFHNLATGYLLEYPPTEPSVMYCGRYLAAFLRNHPLRKDAPYIADLAALERSVVEVFHGPDAPVLEALIRNRALGDEAVEGLARRADAQTQAVIVINQSRILRSPPFHKSISSIAGW